MNDEKVKELERALELALIKIEKLERKVEVCMKEIAVLKEGGNI